MKNLKKQSYQKGFTLVELSVSLVIIGLLVAGSLVGSSLIRGATLKSIVHEVQQFKSAMSQFENSYNSLPGDMANASSYWSASADGDGDGTIDVETSDEPFLAFEHLLNADMIKNLDYSGEFGTGFDMTTTSSSGNVMTIDEMNIYPVCCLTSFYARTIDLKNTITVFSIFPADDDFRAGAISPIEALGIDQKMDDGLPDYGFIGASGSYTGAAYEPTGCYETDDASSGATSSYLSADSDFQDLSGCQMHFGYDWD